MQRDSNQMRTCTKCGREFPATAEFFNVAVTFSKRMGKRYEGLRGDCLECCQARKRERYKAGGEQARQRVTESTRRRRTRPEVREAERVYAREKKREGRSTEEGAARLRDYVRSWRASNPDRYAKYKKNYRGMTPAIAAKVAARHARKLQATPPWVDLKSILPFYERAAELTKQTGIRYSVDHIHPLKGKNLCGLHVPWNLQVITLSENTAKGNRLCQM